MFLKKNTEPKTAQTTQVHIGGVRVGIVGLEDALEAVKSANLTSEAEIGRALVEQLRKNNYIPPAAEAEYRRDLARYYRAKQGLPVDKPAAVPGRLEVKVFGPGCARCKQLFEQVRDIIAREGIAADLEYVTDITEFTAYGVMVTPALAVNGEIKAAGKTPRLEQILDWLKQAGA